jgi:16S rRNA C1402 (ribose-2'-O) methylase RsmI
MLILYSFYFSVVRNYWGQFIFSILVGFLPKHARSRRDRLEISAREAATQIFYVPPHGIQQFLVDAASSFGDSR